MKKYIACLFFIISILTLVLACGGSPQVAENKEGRPNRNFDAAAQKLGISVEQLRNALGGPPPDITHTVYCRSAFREWKQRNQNN